MTGAPDVPKLLRNFDPQVLHLLEDHTATLVQRLLDQQSTARPKMSARVVRYPRSDMFMMLHRLANTTEVLVLLLNRAAERLTATDQHWQITLADPAICSSLGSEAVEIMLHPADVNIVGMLEVPSNVRIFRLSRQGTYEITELPPPDPKQIARERRVGQLAEAGRDWRKNRRVYCAAVAERARAELARQRTDLSPEAAAIISELLSTAVRGHHLLEALEAASHLGILAEVTGNFGQQTK